MPHWNTPDGCRLFFTQLPAETGHPPVVFLNGFAQTAVYWHPVARAVAPKIPSLCYDRRCQGRSTTGAHQPTMDQHVEDLVGLLDHLGIATAHLAGLSHGGLVAAAMAQAHPDRIGRLVICNTRPRGSATTTSVIRRWQNLLRTDGLRALATALVQEGTGPRFRARHGAMLDQLIDAVVARNSAVGLERQLVAMTDDPPLAQILQAVNAPTLIIAATEDPIAPAAESKLLADTIGAEFALIKNVGHSLPAEDPETFSTRIETFLAPQAGDTDAPGQPR